MAVTTLDYEPEAGKVVIDDHKGHPGIKATTLSYGQINENTFFPCHMIEGYSQTPYNVYSLNCRFKYSYRLIDITCKDQM